MSKFDKKTQALMNVLAALGNDPDEIAHKLCSERAFGSRGTLRVCPLANYLRSVFGGSVQVTYNYTYLILRGYGVIAASIPTPIYHFIRKFDSGNYPFLVTMENL